IMVSAHRIGRLADVSRGLRPGLEGWGRAWRGGAMGVGMRWLVAVAGSLAFFVASWASLALGHVWDTGTQVGVAAARMAVVFGVLGWWAPLGREKLQEARMERQHAELVTIKKEVDIKRNEIVALLRNDGSYRITDVVIEATINRDSSEIEAEI